MKILLLCGYFAAENQQEVLDHARSTVQFSANVFQEKLISGLQSLNANVEIISAPFIGSYPNETDIRTFRGFSQPQTVCDYVHFCNIWGLRNFSRAASLKREIRHFATAPSPDKILLVYAAHTPFLEAAAMSKKLDPRIRVGLYVPDLPNYMNLNTSRNLVYDALKYIDNKTMYRYMRCVDGFAVLTEAMTAQLPIGNKPYFVAEGIVTAEQIAKKTESTICNNKKYVVYTGKLNRQFGVCSLIDGFRLLKDPQLRLVLCGEGDAMAYARKAAEKDSRIQITGQVPPEEAQRIQHMASVLINPRPNNEEYTKYSFPSKIIEYLLTGKPVVSYMLNGMPKNYKEFLYPIREDIPAAEAIAQAITNAISVDSMTQLDKTDAFRQYARENLQADSLVEKWISLIR